MSNKKELRLRLEKLSSEELGKVLVYGLGQLDIIDLIFRFMDEDDIQDALGHYDF